DGEPTGDGAPVVALPLDQAEDDGEERGTGQQNADEVESVLPASAHVRDHEERARQRDEADGNVEEEDPPPVPVGDDQPSDGWSSDRRYADHRTSDAEGGAAACGREDGHENRQRLRCE